MPLGRWAELSIWASLGIGLTVAGFLLGPQLVFLFPAYLTVAITRRGWFTGIILTGICLVAAVFLAGVAGTILLFLSVTGFLLAFGLRQQRDPVEVILVGGIILTVGLVAWLLLGLVLSGQPLASGLDYWLHQIRQQLSSELSSLPNGLDDREAFLNWVETFIRMVWPASLMIYSVLGTGINYGISYWVLRRWGVVLANWRPFSRWRLSWGYSWGMIGGLGALLLSDIAGDVFHRTLVTTGLNLTLVFSVIFLIQGMAVAWFWLEKAKVARGLRWGLMVLGLLTVWLPPALTLLGLFDTWFDWRKLEKQAGGNGDASHPDSGRQGTGSAR